METFETMDKDTRYNIQKNAEGYPDPTAYAVLQKEEEEERFKKLLRTIFYICEQAGFHLEERVVLRDNRSGRVWK